MEYVPTVLDKITILFYYNKEELIICITKDSKLKRNTYIYII